MAHITPATPRGRLARQRAYRRHAHYADAGDAVGRILAVFDRAEDDYEAYAEGAGWYLAAHTIAQELSDTYGVRTDQAAGVIAALSPQTGWARNIHLATLCLASEEVPHFPDAVAKAAYIANGAPPEVALGGRKVRSFFANISRPSAPGPVTVDRHAYAIAYGLPFTGRNDRSLERPGVYARTAGAYRTAARTVGLLPHQLQAIVWCQHRRETGADRFDNHNGALLAF